MNLSEIRKKAQLEKAGSVDASAFPLEITPSESTGPVTGPMEPGKDDFVHPDVAVIRPQPLPLPESPLPQAIDPLALVLAGRALVRNCVGSQTGDHVPDLDGDDFQELLCFRVADEMYAVNIMEIKEIIKPRKVTEVPRVPPYVSGVLSLRGIIIPVFNMHKRLGHTVVKPSGKERVVVVKRGEEFCGVMVDEVIQVVRISSASIEPPPAVLEGLDRDFVGGIGRFEGQMLILLNLGKILDMNLV